MSRRKVQACALALTSAALACLVGCAYHEQTLRTTLKSGQPVEETQRHVSVLRRGEYLTASTVNPDGTFHSVAAGCDHGASGNATLGAVALGGVFGGWPGIAAAGVAQAASSALSPGQDVDHEQQRCAVLAPAKVQEQPDPAGGAGADPADEGG